MNSKASLCSSTYWVVMVIFGLLMYTTVSKAQQSNANNLLLRAPGQAYGALLQAPTGLAGPDVIFTFPTSGGMLLAASSLPTTAWVLTGNSLSGTGNDPTQLLGSTNDFHLKMITNNVERLRIANTGELTLMGTAGTPNLTVQSLGAQGGAVFSPGTEFVLVADAAGLVRARPSSEVASVSNSVLYNQTSTQTTAVTDGTNYLYDVAYNGAPDAAITQTLLGARISSPVAGIAGTGHTVTAQGLTLSAALSTLNGGGTATNKLSANGLKVIASTATTGSTNEGHVVGINVQAQTQRTTGTAASNTNSVRGITLDLQGDGFDAAPDVYNYTAGMRGIDLHTKLDYNQGTAVGLNIEMEVTGTPTTELLGARMRGQNIISLLDAREFGWTTGDRKTTLRLKGSRIAGEGAGEIAFFNQDVNSSNTEYLMARIVGFNGGNGSDQGGLRFYTANSMVENSVPALVLNEKNYLGVGISDPSAPLYLSFDNNSNTGPSVALAINRRCVGASTGSFGSTIAWSLDNDASNAVNAGSIGVQFDVVTAGSEASSMFFQTNTLYGGNSTRLSLDKYGNGNFTNSLKVYDSLLVGGSGTPSAALQVNGQVALNERSLAINSADGDLLAFEPVGGSTTYSFIRIDPTGSINLKGIKRPGNLNGSGHILIIYFDGGAGENLTIFDQSGGAASTNRIATMTGGDITITEAGVVSLIYSLAESRWLVTSFNP